MDWIIHYFETACNYIIDCIVSLLNTDVNEQSCNSLVTDVFTNEILTTFSSYQYNNCQMVCPQVSQLYDVVQKWDAMSTSVPQVVQRLVAVKELHEQGKTDMAESR